jgi:hypothetical protein
VADPWRAIAALTLATLGLLVVACNRGPAEDALAVADQALAAARPELERYAPGELDKLGAAARQVRAQLDRGQCTEALKAAMALPSRIQVAVAVAAAKKEQLLAAWDELSARLPRTLEGLAARTADLEAARKVPRGLDEAGFAAAKADVASLSRTWTEATAAFERGDVPGAVEAAREVEAKAAALAAMLGPTAAPAPPEPASARPDIIGPSGPDPGSNP